MKLSNLVKYNKVVLCLYRLFGNAFVKFLSIFVKVNDKKILFIDLGGRKYERCPKILYERMRDDPFFEDYEFVWAFINPREHDDIGCRTVKCDTISFLIEALSARIWINNSSMERGLKLRRKKTIEFNTWHGTPIKKLGNDINDNKSFKSITKKIGTQIYCAQSEYDREIFSRIFNVSLENVIISDMPRNDILANPSISDVMSTREKLGISNDKKIILYMPTYREFNKDSSYNCFIKPPIDIRKWEKTLGDKYVLLFRAHYEVTKILGIEDSDFIKNVSDYSPLHELLLASDMLISDYSGSFFEFGMLERPMFNFAYDYDEYCKYRGLYLDIEKDMGLKINYDEDSLLKEILEMNYEEYCEKTRAFKNKYAPVFGNATETIVEKIKEVLTREK